MRSEPFHPDAPAIAELAAGLILCRRSDQRVLLLHERDEDRWCFPKGHVEPGESLVEAARRETMEEAGLAELSVDRELAESRYRFFDLRRRVNVFKTTVYFLGRTDSDVGRLEPIFDRAEWLAPSEALVRVRYPADRAPLETLLASEPPTVRGRTD
ncbi:MAG: NUDIX hydrolase [Thermoplasmata archaeon]|jgi:diadenosine hexaphosphate hydrolase (ATP-forming)